jgi:hypothetical protein
MRFLRAQQPVDTFGFLALIGGQLGPDRRIAGGPEAFDIIRRRVEDNLAALGAPEN